MAKPKLALIPAAQGSKFYSVLPSSGVGDFTFTRSGSATRINSQGLIETVANGVSRLNYPLIDGKVVGCPSHLLEPERLQLIRYSEDFSQSAFYDLSNDVTIENSSIISPKGIIGVQELRENSDNDDHLIKSVNTFTEADCSFSIFAKYKGNDRNIKLSLGTGKYASFDLQNGTYFDVQAATVAEIEEYPNGWYRCVINGNISASKLNIILLNNTTETYQGDGASGVYIWGAQLEQGSYPTSYIKSNGSQTTRSAETANNSGDASTFNDSEGVLMAELSIDANDGNFRFLSISNGNSNNQNVVWIYYRSDTNQINFRVIVGGTSSFDQIYTINNATINTKLLLKYKENDFSAWVNGFEVLTDNLGITFPIGTLNELEFNRPDGVSNFYGNTKQLQYYDTALTDSELEQLTSWVSFSDMAEGQLYTIE